MQNTLARMDQCPVDGASRENEMPREILYKIFSALLLSFATRYLLFFSALTALLSLMLPFTGPFPCFPLSLLAVFRLNAFPSLFLNLLSLSFLRVNTSFKLVVNDSSSRNVSLTSS